MPVSATIEDSGTHINIRSEMRFYDLCRTLPGASWKSDRKIWRMPLSWASCVQLKTTFGVQLEPSPELTDWLRHEYQNRVYPAMILRDQLELPEGEGDQDLYPHQRAGVKFLSTARRALLADEPGLGKTAQSIRALLDLQRQNINQFPVLVVCPSTLKQNWKREIDRWWPGLRTLIIDGSAVTRRKQFETFLAPKEGELKPHVIIINWENLRNHSRVAPYGSIALKRCEEHGGEDPKITPVKCEVHEKELNKIQFEAIIADEVHRAKNPKSVLTRALWAASGKTETRCQTAAYH